MSSLETFPRLAVDRVRWPRSAKSRCAEKSATRDSNEEGAAAANQNPQPHIVVLPAGNPWQSEGLWTASSIDDPGDLASERQSEQVREVGPRSPACEDSAGEE